MSMLFHVLTTNLPISWRSHVDNSKYSRLLATRTWSCSSSILRWIPEFYIKNAYIWGRRGGYTYTGNWEGQSPTWDVWNRTRTSRWRVWHISCRNVSLRMHRNVGHNFRMPAILVWIISISRFKNGNIIWRSIAQSWYIQLYTGIRSANISAYTIKGLFWFLKNWKKLFFILFYFFPGKHS